MALLPNISPEPMLRALVHTTILTVVSAVIGNFLKDVALSDIPESEAAKVADQHKLGDQLLFHFDILPRLVVDGVTMAALNYVWHVWLEQLIPTRKPGSATTQTVRDSAYSKSDIKASSSSDEIAKNQKTSFSWRNALVQWVIDISVGHLWREQAQKLIYLLAHGKPQKLPGSVGGNFVMQMFIGDTTAVATLFAILAVPAERRIVFLTGFDLVWETGVWIVIIALLPTAYQNE